ncbi:MAG: hypothetical protein ACU84Q_12650 [Gammaproteobacteria bacterium]
MSTGIEHWFGSMADIGPLYPFVGSEFLLWCIGIVFWIAWQVSCTRAEDKQYKDEIAKHGDRETLKKLIDRH